MEKLDLYVNVSFCRQPTMLLIVRFQKRKTEENIYLFAWINRSRIKFLSQKNGIKLHSRATEEIVYLFL